MIDSSFDFPGWKAATDPRTGRQYFINLQEKTTTWEDPRIKYKHVYGPAIPMQTLHGSSPKNVQVYPTQNYPAQAFQSSQGQSINASPIPSTRTSNHSHTAVEMSSLSRSSPHTPRVGSLIKDHQQMLQQQQQETSFSSPTPMETEATVSKINTMFPTASENHIRLLLKKYLKSMFPKAEETVILDVLATVDNNVQKASENLIRMGYDKKEMTPAPRLAHRKKEEYQPQKEVIQPTPPPKPKTNEEKKKMKVRLVAQFKESLPEKIISIALESVDYSEEKALKILDIVLRDRNDTKPGSEMENKNRAGGIEKSVSFKESSTSKSIDLDQAAAIENDETMIINSDHSIITTPIESPETDDVYGQRKKVSADYEEATTSSSSEASTSKTSAKKTVEKVERRRPKARSDSNRSEKNIVAGRKETRSESSIFNGKNAKDEKFMSIYTQSSVSGPNDTLAKGPKDELLLSDYVTWSGANPDYAKGHKINATGPNPNLRIDKTYTPRGRGSELCKGPKIGLAKGSIYSQINRPNVACN